MIALNLNAVSLDYDGLYYYLNEKFEQLWQKEIISNINQIDLNKNSRIKSSVCRY